MNLVTKIRFEISVNIFLITVKKFKLLVGLFTLSV